MVKDPCGIYTTSRPSIGLVDTVPAGISVGIISVGGISDVGVKICSVCVDATPPGPGSVGFPLNGAVMAAQAIRIIETNEMRRVCLLLRCCIAVSYVDQ
jgi:hypothetical protein